MFGESSAFGLDYMFCKFSYVAISTFPEIFPVFYERLPAQTPRTGGFSEFYH
jgi:hypothetical protein